MHSENIFNTLDNYDFFRKLTDTLPPFSHQIELEKSKESLISDLKEANRKIEHLAFYDSLTNLPNRRLMQERLSQTLKYLQGSGKFGALLFIDLDHFKKVNDSTGHESGDSLLKEVSSRLKDAIRKEDTVARFGGDEFTVLLAELELNEVDSTCYVEKVAEHLRKLIVEEVVLTEPYNIKLNISCSIGIALFNAND